MNILSTESQYITLAYYDYWRVSAPHKHTSLTSLPQLALAAKRSPEYLHLKRW